MATKPSLKKNTKQEAVEAVDTAVAEVAEAAPKQGRAIILPNGEKRAEYIRRRYAEGISRGDIMREINAMLEEAGRGEEKIPYQIVFAATKQKKEKVEAEGEESDDSEEEDEE